MDCPCTSGLSYSACCQPYHMGKKRPFPLPLMRSRFAAFALGKVGYILKTQQQANAHLRRELKQFCAATSFLGLQILDEAQLTADSATVTFRATLLQNGLDASFTECSLFERKNGRWIYIRPL